MNENESKIACSFCNLIIDKQKHIAVRKDGRIIAYLHNRYQNDCYQRYLNKQPGFGRIGRQYPR